MHDRNYEVPGWQFITGKKTEVFNFIQNNLKFKGINKPFAHSNEIVLFSSQGKIVFRAAAFSENKLLKKKIQEELIK